MLFTKGLEVYYEKIKALLGVSIKVPKGKLYAILGSNGAGKSTFLKAIMGLEFCSYGVVEFEGRRIENIHPSKIVKLGMTLIPEGRHIFPELTVDENLRVGAFLRSNAKEIKRDIELVFSLFPHLKGKRKTEGRFLSGGEQQMVAVGRALLTKPKLLLMDEPSMGLSPLLVKEVFNIIERINKEEKMTILLVEQNLKLALNIAEYAYVMQNGRVERYGTSESLLNDAEVKGAYLGEGKYIDKKQIWEGKIRIKK